MEDEPTQISDNYAPQSERPPVTHFAQDIEQSDSTNEMDSHDDHFSEAAVEVGLNESQPSKSEIAEVCSELRRLQINPQPCLGLVKKYWTNVAAIARVKDAIAEGWCDNPTSLFINSCNRLGYYPYGTYQ